MTAREKVLNEATDNLKRFTEINSPENIVNINNKQIAKVAVTVDGTWQKRGHNSRIGVVFILSVDTGEVLDVMVKCLFCTECNFNKIKFKNNTVEFNSWYSSHKGSRCINREESSSSMEAKGAAEHFLHSIEKGNLMYTTFVGDGDSDCFGTVKEECEKLGIGYDIVKEECVGHIQKRLETALRQLKLRTRGTKLADGN